MKKHDKVYWVKGWPNNGCGYFLFKIPFVNFFIVKDKSGKIIFCGRVVPLLQAIKNKESTVEDGASSSSQTIKDLSAQNDLEADEMKKFANEKV